MPGVEGNVIVRNRVERPRGEGYNVATGEYEDLSGRRKLTRRGHPHRAAEPSSIAGLLLTTECMITGSLPGRKSPPRQPRAPMGGMDY